MNALAIDVGSTSIRTALVNEYGHVTNVQQAPLTIRSPQPGGIELDPEEIVRLSIELAQRTLTSGGRCDVVGITNQRATTIVFDPENGSSVGPAISWQDLRTVIDCLVLQGQGLRLAPNQSATKIKWLLDHTERTPDELRFATIETWIAWHLSEGVLHITDRSNAGVTGLIDQTGTSWDAGVLATLGLDPAMLPTIVDTMGDFGTASALPGSPRIAALVGDQSASLFGQSCIRSGAKITFGTGAMLDMIHGDAPPTTMNRYPSGCYPIAARSFDGATTWGVEAIVLSAGTCVEWLRDLGLIASASETNEIAASVTSTNGVSFVPAFSGLGTPYWDFGARGGFFGITRGTTRAHLVRAVLEGIAHRGVDLLDAAEEEIGETLGELRVDGGMSANEFFVQRLADFSGRTVSVSSEREATTRGAGLMALVSAGHLSLEDVENLWSPALVTTPTTSPQEQHALRATWRCVIQRAANTIPELSAVAF